MVFTNFILPFVFAKQAGESAVCFDLTSPSLYLPLRFVSFVLFVLFQIMKPEQKQKQKQKQKQRL